MRDCFSFEPEIWYVIFGKVGILYQLLKGILACLWDFIALV
jgi:hypothetical protein